MTKINEIFSCSQEATTEQVIKALEGVFAHFGSLEPISTTLSRTMVAVVDGDRAALGLLAQVVESVTCDQISHFEFRWNGVTIVTPTSGTKISLNRGSNPGWYKLGVKFPGGSTHRAQKTLAAFEVAGVEYHKQ